MSADKSYHALVSGRARGWRPALARLGLSAASGPYAAAVWLRNRLYDRGWKRSQRAAVPVVLCAGPGAGAGIRMSMRLSIGTNLSAASLSSFAVFRGNE